MTLQEYLQEDGKGKYAPYVVPDLVPPAGEKAELLIVLESPHIDELKTGKPLSGSAGCSALKFLAPAASSREPLGLYIAQRHGTGDFRVAIVNVSPVPLQVQAYLKSDPSPILAASDWATMLAIQGSQANSISELRVIEQQSTNRLLISGLQRRVNMFELSSAATVFTSGAFAHRTWKEIAPRHPNTTLSIPHPSRSQWQRTLTRSYKTQEAEQRRLEHKKNLLKLQTLFIANTI